MNLRKYYLQTSFSFEIRKKKLFFLKKEPQIDCIRNKNSNKRKTWGANRCGDSFPLRVLSPTLLEIETHIHNSNIVIHWFHDENRLPNLIRSSRFYSKILPRCYKAKTMDTLDTYLENAYENIRLYTSITSSPFNIKIES